MNSGLDRAEEIFNEALKRPKDERTQYITAACRGDTALETLVTELLLAHGDIQESFLSLSRQQGQEFVNPHDGNRRHPSSDESVLNEHTGQQIGNYRLVAELGKGGFGVVWLAEQMEPIKRNVAFKILKLGMDTREVVARFQQERQALAMMDHPNIAKVFDAGITERGRPFFAMEFVRGTSITEYCDEAECSTEERLKLFLLVCSAIQHAHQRGIIHRDIKPSNVLVTVIDGVATPRVIDFGIAKATQQRLTDISVLTQLQAALGTPMYMSPEQADTSQADVDIRSDIYSLGVLLYELLTSTTPFNTEMLLKNGLREIRRTICDEEPAKPSTALRQAEQNSLTTIAKKRRCTPSQLLKEITGDLDWIVTKAIEKERGRRYDSAAAFASDLQRHLAREPVTARPPSATYRLGRLVQRNRAASLAVFIVVMALTLGGIISIHSSYRVYTEAKRSAAVLDRLRSTAPSFFALALSHIESGQIEQACQELAFAREMQPSNTEIAGAYANALQALQRLPDAAAQYRLMTMRGTKDVGVAHNLALCERLIKQNGNAPSLRRDLQEELFRDLITQQRNAEAVPLGRVLNREQEATEPLVVERLKEYAVQPDWNRDRIARCADGTFAIDFGSMVIRDLSQLAGLPVSSLSFAQTSLATLKGVSRIPLVHLSIRNAPHLSDIGPLNDTTLNSLTLVGARITDIRPLQGLPLESLDLYASDLTDISPLKGMNLHHLNLYESPVEDLTPLKGMPLEELVTKSTRLNDISPLSGLPLRSLDIRTTRVTDLSPLRSCTRLEEVSVPEIASDVTILKHIKSIERIGYGTRPLQPAPDFWKWFEHRNSEDELRSLKAVAAEKAGLYGPDHSETRVAEAMRAQALLSDGKLADAMEILKRLNPEGGSSPVVWSNAMPEIAALRGIPLGTLWIRDTTFSNTEVLRGILPSMLILRGTKVQDLTPISTMKLRELRLNGTPVSDLTPLKGMPLESLQLSGTHVKDLTPVGGMPLRTLHMENCLETVDLTPLKHCTDIQEIVLPPDVVHLEVLRPSTSIKHIGFRYNEATRLPDQTFTSFWAANGRVAIEQLARNGDFTMAERYLRGRIAPYNNPELKQEWSRLGAVCLASKDQNRYKAACADWFFNLRNWESMSVTRPSLVLLLLAKSDCGAPLEEIATMVEEAYPEDTFLGRQPWSLVIHGLLSYRQGQFADAQKCLQGVQKAPAAAGIAYPVLAMTCFQLGNNEQAEAALERAHQIIDEQWPSVARCSQQWHLWLIAHVLLSEADNLRFGL